MAVVRRYTGANPAHSDFVQAPAVHATEKRSASHPKTAGGSLAGHGRSHASPVDPFGTIVRDLMSGGVTLCGYVERVRDDSFHINFVAKKQHVVKSIEKL